MDLTKQISEMACMNRSNGLNLNRRDFLKVSLTAGGGLLICWNLPFVKILAGESVTHFQPNPFIRIDPDNTITIWVGRPEMGQGSRTSMPMIVAEELEADWSSIRIEQAQAHPNKYGKQNTGGSHSVETQWEPLRKAGATAREMLTAAAAQIWNVEKKSCYAQNSTIIHKSSGKKLTYGELIKTAVNIEPSEDPPLKNPEDFNIIGRNKARFDGPQIVDGSAVYGMDVKLPGMLYATIKRCPVYQGKVVYFDDTQAKAVKGVRDVIQIDPVDAGGKSLGGVVIIAEISWAAIQGQRALKVTWEEGGNNKWNSDGISKKFKEYAEKSGVDIYSKGDPEVIIKNASRKIEAIYETPYLAHATMEPMNCTADVRDDFCEVWVPTQFPQWVQWEIRRLTGLPPEKVKVNITLLGGGFGRRINPDYAIEAVQISKAVKAPVKVIWTREDDIRHDRFHPAGLQRLTAALDEEGYPVAWTHRIVEPNHSVFYNPDFNGTIDPQSLTPPYLPYDISNVNFNYVFAHAGIPIGWWRSVDKHRHAFAMESFIDELAAAGSKDPFEYRLQLLDKPREINYGEDVLHTRRLKGVLKLAAEKAGWGRMLPDGRAMGIACYSYIDCKSYVAEVAEVSVSNSGQFKVHRVVCAADCGIAVNPDTIKAQFEGGVVFGLSAILYPQITIDNGRAQQSNFHNYEIPTMEDTPEVEVHIIPSDEVPGGIGEPCIPPLAPAVANAIYALTGKRIRHLPILAENIRNG